MKLTIEEANRLKAERAAARAAARKAREEEAAKINAAYLAERAEARAKRARFNARVLLPVEDGCVMVFSDAHFWRGAPSPAYRASLVIAKKLKPWAIINNGDSLDGSSISRYDPTSFVNLRTRLTVEQELELNLKHLRAYEALPSAKFRVWNLGNHDARYESYLAKHVPEFSGVSGFHLKDHFPGWLPAWSTWIVDGDDRPLVMVKHRFRGGMYAPANNTLYAGCSIVTGHLHTLWAKAFTDVNGIRWGVDAGTLQDIHSEAFLDYTEDNPVNWQSGFVLLHFRSGRFTGPELIYALPDGSILFRGDVLEV